MIELVRIRCLHKAIDDFVVGFGHASGVVAVSIGDVRLPRLMVESLSACIDFDQMSEETIFSGWFDVGSRRYQFSCRKNRLRLIPQLGICGSGHGWFASCMLLSGIGSEPVLVKMNYLILFIYCRATGDWRWPKAALTR